LRLLGTNLAVSQALTFTFILPALLDRLRPGGGFRLRRSLQGLLLSWCFVLDRGLRES
jgi:hypothetical protein